MNTTKFPISAHIVGEKAGHFFSLSEHLCNGWLEIVRTPEENQ